ncbi:MAG: hypothetical protein KA191_03475 [Verrucomicrobia bacterium]|jgi:hypothetical protein|nr:hypothetical protein [Verrucomicrobiota bacterium]OQC66767.1 MAG: hypothetical protein BWX48_01353 [Verrucomicrobia bacterium ADurb.Bin006]MDI9381574.1 glycosyl hydrolase [Verrucomicrobiota bacterium]NMD22373.1 hypothetical protein [Verrucomicrobiota bacterium]HOF47248.1 glycosyl hydrolase [Verrucomicrobiota bacterium]
MLSINSARNLRFFTLTCLLCCSLAFALRTPQGQAAQAPDAPAGLAERFVQPPAQTRILKIIHGWPDEPGRQDDLIGRLQNQGFGGVVCNVAFENYLESEAKWAAFTRAVEAARQAGMALWLYDEKGYPSANAGGLVLRDHPEWEARGLLAKDAETGAGPATLELPPGRLFLAAAYPVRDGDVDFDGRVDLSAHVRDGRVSWTAPEGRWRLLGVTEAPLYEGTHADGNLWRKMPYPNLLEAAPTARFLELTHARYAKEMGPDLGRHFVATFTDEPSLMSLFLRRMPYRPLPWSTGLSAEFRKRHGYALEDAIPSLLVGAGPRVERHRHDFWQTVGELVAENFFGQIQDWCRRHGVQSGGHLLAEEGLTAHVALYGDFFACLRRLDAPGIDCLTSLPPEVPWHIARLAGSAAELDRRPFVMCETSDHGQVYRPAGDARAKRVVTEAEIRGTCNRLFTGGVNVITSYYSFTGMDDAALRRLNEWVGRCATLLAGGHQVADVAVVYPIESLWTRFIPAEHWANASPGANRIEHLYRNALESLFASRRDLTVIDSRTLIEARVLEGELAHNALRWQVVVLPGIDTLPEAAWDRLDDFMRQGGTVIALGARPANTESEFPDRRIRAWGERAFGETGDGPIARTAVGRGTGVFLSAGIEALLPRVLDQIIEPDLAVPNPRAPLRLTHRRVDGHEVYFVINDSPVPWQGAIECRASGAAEQWDPATGQRSVWPGKTATELVLPPYGATFLRFDGPPLPARKLNPGVSPSMTFKELPAAQAAVARGEFVRETMSADSEATRPGRPGWRVEGTLTRSDVDTFLFVRLPFEDSLDLSAADLLEIESWVPEGQHTPTQLLVILHERGGGDFLASTPRSLSAAGYDRCYLPLDRLQLAGWSSDNDATLDRRRIDEIRVGWGGYVGREGERIEFSLRMPRAGAIGAGTGADVR